MEKSSQQKYYDEHYSISNQDSWKSWVPNPRLSARELKDFSFGDNAQETVLSLIAPYAPFKSTLDIGCSAGDFIIPISKSSTVCHGVDIVDFSFAWLALYKR